MEVADAQAETLVRILTELLSCAGFVAALKAAGFTSIPYLVRSDLLESLGNRIVPVTSKVGTGTACRKPGSRMRILDDTHAVFTEGIMPVRTLKALAGMTPSRQSTVASVMRSVDNFTGDFACALLAATPARERSDVAPHHFANAQRTRRFARLEKQLAGLSARSQILSPNHDANLVRLAVNSSFVRGWICSSDLLAWLRASHPDHLTALQRIVAAGDATKNPRRPMKLPYAIRWPSVPRNQP
jgi:hypothetical protein